MVTKPKISVAYHDKGLFIYLFIYLFIFIYLFKSLLTYFERDRDSASEGGAEREGEGESQVGSMLPA